MGNRKNSLSRVRVKIMVWSMRRNISSKIEDMLYKHCGVKPPKKPRAFFDPKTGQIDLKYDPGDFDKDYFL